jgi:hypothetical protein
MNHITEEELIAYRENMASERAEIAGHLSECANCRKELARIEAVLSALDTLPVPDPGKDYGRRVWQQIAPRLSAKPSSWWQARLEPKRLVALGSLAAVILTSFYVGRISKPGHLPDVQMSQENVRERILVVAVGAHLGRSEMMLVELSNAEPRNPGQQQVNISSEQHRAEDLLEENRLYRQTALKQGDAQLASILDELERVLLDVAHSPDEVSPAQLEAIRQKIESRGILFKVRVVGKELQKRERASVPAPAQKYSSKKERNKV